MKKRLIAALCLLLCTLFSGVIGYFVGNSEYHKRIDHLNDPWNFDQNNPPLVADAEAAVALAEAYYRDNIDLNGNKPRLADSVSYCPQSGTWSVCLMLEDYVLQLRESSSRDFMMVGDSYYIEILAEDGTILIAQFGE